MKFLRATGRLLYGVFLPIKNNTAFFVFMFVLGYVCQLVEKPDKAGEPVFELFLDLYVVCLMLSVIPRKLRRLARAVAYVVLYATTVADTFCFLKFGSPLTPTMLLLAFETTGGEAAEFVSSYLSWDIVSSPLGWILLVMLAHAVFNVAVALTRRIVSGNPPCGRNRAAYIYNKVVRGIYGRLKQAGMVAYPLMGLAVIVCCAKAVADRWDNKQAMARLLANDTIGKVEHELTRKDRADLYLPVYRFAFSVFANGLAADQVDKLIEAKDKIKIDSCSYRSSNIVLVIGESYNRHHSQLYGYDKPTTPRQVRLRGSGRLTQFTDVVSSWNLTSFVFKHIFSLYAVGDNGEWCDYPLFPAVFRRAGYKVTFVTNQFLPALREAVFDFSGGFFLNNPTLAEAQFDVRNDKLYKYDAGVVRELDRLMEQGKVGVAGSDDRNLIILHLRGQHVNYRDRVPKGRRKFAAADYVVPSLPEKSKRILADYDNATLYNDSVVDQIVRRFESQDAIVIYMPDHGEECFGGGLNIFGRQHQAAVDYRLAHEEFEIPFWIWCSDKYAARHPDIVGQIKAAAGRPLMTDVFAHTLLWLGGISTPHYRPDHNVLDGQYNCGRRRILKGTADYDKLRQEKNEKDSIADAR